MKRSKQFLKRGISLLLVFTMVLSMMPVVHVHAEENVPTASLVDLIVKNYTDLSEEEKAVFKAGVLKDKTLSYRAPVQENSDALVSVESANKKVTAKVFQDEKGNLWTPVKYTVTVGEEVKETVALTKSGSVYLGVFTGTYEAYNIDVTYQLQWTVEHSALLNAVYELVDDYAALASLKEEDIKTLLGGLEMSSAETGNMTAIELIEKMANGGYELEVPGGFGDYLPGVNTTIVISGQPTKDASSALVDSMVDGKLPLSSYVNQTTLKWLVTDDRETLFDAIISSYENVKAMAEDPNGVATIGQQIQDLIDACEDADATVISQINDKVTDLNDAIDDLNTKIGDLNTKIGQLNDKIEDLNDQLPDGEPVIDTIDTIQPVAKVTVNTNGDDAQTALTKIDTALGTVGTSLTNLGTQLTGLGTDLSTLNSRIGEVITDIDETVEEANKQMDEAFDAINDEIDKVNVNLADEDKISHVDSVADVRALKGKLQAQANKVYDAIEEVAADNDQTVTIENADDVRDLKTDLQKTYNELLDTLNEELAEANATVRLYVGTENYFNTNVKNSDEVETEIGKMEDLLKIFPNLQDALTALEDARDVLVAIEDAVAQIDENLTNLDQLDAAIEAVNTALVGPNGNDGLEAAEDALAEAADYKAQLQDAQQQLNTAKDQLTPAQEEIASAGDTIDAAREDIAAAKDALLELPEKVESMKEMKKVIDKLPNLMTKFCDALAGAYQRTKSDAWYLDKNADILADQVDYAVLNEKVAAAVGHVTHRSPKEQLDVTEGTVRSNVGTVNVTVKLTVQAVGKDNVLTELTWTPDEMISVTEGTTKDVLLQKLAAAGVEAQGLATFDAYFNINTTNYTRTVSVLPETVTEDLVYEIFFVPKKMQVTKLWEAVGQQTYDVDYGELMVLPTHENSAKGYVYTVTVGQESQTLYQGTQIRVLSNMTIARVEGDAMTAFYLEDLLPKTHTVDPAVLALLNSGALNKSQQVLLRVPGDLATVEENTITVPDYPAGLGDLVWIATSAKATLNGGGTENVVLVADNGSHKGTIQGLWTKVDIYYTLTFGHSDLDVTAGQLESALLLPHTLHTEYTIQKSQLDQLAASAGELSILNAELIGTLNVAMGQLSTAEGKAAVETIVNRINAGDGTLMLAKMANQYKNGGMVYYYRDNNSILFRQEMEIMCQAMNDLLDDPQFKSLWESQGASAAGGKSYEDLLDIRDELNGVTLQAVNPAINNSPEKVIDPDTNQERDPLVILVDALEDIQTTVSSVNTSSLVWTETMSRTGANYSSVNVTVSYKGQTMTSDAVTVVKGSALSQADYNTLAGYLSDMETKLGVDKSHYTVSGALPAAGTVISADTAVQVNWTAKTYTVVLEGEAPWTITYENRTIQLPACTQAGHRYDYTIDNEVLGAGAYTFAADRFDALFANGTYTITRKLVNIADEKMSALVGEMNGAAILSKDDAGNYSIVVPVDPAAAKDDLVDFVMGLVLGNQYSYIGMKTGEYSASLLEGGSQMVPAIDTFYASGKYHLQTLLDGIANSGTGTDVILSAINTDGSVNHMNLAGQTVLVGAAGETLTALGGKVLELQLYFGEDDENNVPVKLYLTLNGAASELTSLRNKLADLKDYVQVVCEDGRFKLNVTLPELAYEAYMALLLIKGEADIRNFEQVNAVTAFGWIMELMDGVLEDPDVTLDTYINTAEKLGQTIQNDLSGYEATYQKLVGYYNKGKNGIHEEQDGWYIDPVVSIDSVVDNQLQKLVDQAAAAMNLPAGSLTMSEMIAEYGTEGIHFTAAAKLTNLNTTYDALVFDLQKAELKKLAGLEENLVANAPALSGMASVTLLRDVTVPAGEKLTFSTTTVLDLNGYTITGDIAATDTLIITDSRIGSENAGQVTGSITGSKVMINAGYYPNCDVSAYLKNGFAQDAQTGMVSSTLYTVSKTEAAAGAGYDDEIVITVNASAAELRQAANKQSLALTALDAVLDTVLSYYNSANLYVEGEKVIDLSVEDVVNLISGSDRMDKLINESLSFFSAADLADLVNRFTADLTDFAALKDAVDNGTPVAGYTFSVAPWDIQVRRAAGDYVTADIGGIAAEAKTGKISIVIDGAQKDAISTVLGAFADTIDVDLQLALNDLQLSGTSIPVTGEVDGSLVADFSHDPNYVIMMAVILANSADTALKNELVAAVEEYYGSSSLAEMETVFDTISVEDLCTALRGNGNFAAMVDALPLQAATKQAIKSEIDGTEKGYYAVIEAVGRVLTRLDVTGTEGALNGKTMGGVKKTEKKTDAATQEQIDVNYYGVSKSRSFDKSVGLPGAYTLDTDIQVSDLSLKLYLFTDVARINVSCNGVVTEYEDLATALKHVAAAHQNCTVYVNLAQTELKEDVELNHDVTIVHANRIAAGSKTIKLATGVELHTDAAMPQGMLAAKDSEQYTIGCTQSGNTYIYKPVENRVHVKNPNGDVLYSGEDLAEAIKAAVAGSVITINEEMELLEDVLVEESITLENAENIDFGDKKLILDTEAVLVTDYALPAGAIVPEDADRYTISRTFENGVYTYTALENAVHVNKGEDLLSSGDDLMDAFAAATDGSTLQINRPVALTGDVTLHAGVTIQGAAKINFATFRILLDPNGVLVTDSALPVGAVVPVDGDRYTVTCTEANGVFTYAVLENLIHVTRGSTLLYSGSDLNAAFEAAMATDGSTITVNRAVTLSQKVTLTGVTVTIVGAGNITFEKEIVLGMNSAELKADADISAHVVSGLADRYVLCVNNTYSLAKYPYQVGSNYFTTLQDAIDSISDSGVITVYGAAELSGQITVSGKQISVVGADALSVDLNTLRITLSQVGDSFQLDAVPAGVSAQELKSHFVSGAGTCSTVEVTVTSGVQALVKEKHTMVEKVDDQYLKATATTTAAAQYWKSCSVCGTASTTEYFSHGSPLNTAPTITKPVISGSSNLLYGHKIDTDNKMLYLDIHKNGMTVEELKAILGAAMTNDADNKPTVTVNLTANFNNQLLVCTGSTVVLTAENSSGQKASITYQVVIMGDTNSNGRVESNDSLRMSLHYVKKQELTGLQLLAADNNQNGRIESNDALKNAIKFTGRAQHVSGLKNDR
ncbi:MAG: hypothetical protein E7457_02780 [Ruminococcaceae bacterium]|nr:hypothetical protein [Oscillospiraceae bacterium]